jgi:hypothetical protein
MTSLEKNYIKDYGYNLYMSIDYFNGRLQEGSGLQKEGDETITHNPDKSSSFISLDILIQFHQLS